MSDILTIDTGAGVIKQERVQPLPVYDENHPLLKMQMPEFDDFGSDKLIATIKALKLTRKLYGGLGLSANQCGIPIRAFVIGTEDFDFVCINPKVIAVSSEMSKDKEGCLSYPGMYMSVARPSWAVVEFQDEYGKKNEMKLDGVTARCFLHETDHLNGIRFTEIVGKTTLQMARKKQLKIMKKYTRQKKS